MKFQDRFFNFIYYYFTRLMSFFSVIYEKVKNILRWENCKWRRINLELLLISRKNTFLFCYVNLPCLVLFFGFYKHGSDRTCIDVLFKWNMCISFQLMIFLICLMMFSLKLINVKEAVLRGFNKQIICKFLENSLESTQESPIFIRLQTVIDHNCFAIVRRLLHNYCTIISPQFTTIMAYCRGGFQQTFLKFS